MATFDRMERVFRAMRATDPPVVPKAPRRPMRKIPINDVYHHRDETTGRKFRVEHLVGSTGVIARMRGRVALRLEDLPPHMRTLAKVRNDGSYEHVYERALKNVKNLTDESRTTWYQPMFKRRRTEVLADGTRRHLIDWYGKLDSYWDAGVAAVAAAMAKERINRGAKRAEVETVGQDMIDMARAYATAKRR